MPPRKSVGRTVTATPARTTRATSAIAVDSPTGRRTTRSTSQQPGVRDDVVNNPQLPELQTQQSYAYGSTKTPTLPEQLNPKDMSLRQIADNIDDGVDESDRQLGDQIVQKQQEMGSSPPVARTRRNGARESSQAASEKAQPRLRSTKTQPILKDKEARVAAWADSLDDDNLDEIPEEDDEQSELPDDATHRDTEPSSFPSVILDHSYNYERGLRKPRPVYQPREHGPSLFRRTWEASKTTGSDVRGTMTYIWASITAWTGRLGTSSANALKRVPESPLIAGTITLLVATILLATFSFLFCSLYTRVICDPTSTSVVAFQLQRFCGACTTTTSMTSPLSAPLDNASLSQINSALTTLNKQIASLETRLSQRISQNQVALESEISSLKDQQATLSTHLHNTHFQGSNDPNSHSGIRSPLIPKINFFAPSLGAIVHPLYSSPTRARPKPFLTRVLLRLTGLTKYSTNPPITALEPWLDVGDCWCGPDTPRPSHSNSGSSPQDILRLAVSTREMLYPTELVIEHFPVSGSLRPDTTPRVIQLWADFSHIGFAQWTRLRLGDRQQDNVLGPRHAKIGEMEYVADVSGARSGGGRAATGAGVPSGVGHVQTFKLDVNQHGLMYAARDFVVRVKENYGAEFGCLYRVRLHGVPMDGVGSEGEEKGDDEEGEEEGGWGVWGG